MPNHYHILAKQTLDNGVSKYIADLQNSYARYINVKNKRFGSLFQTPFKAVRIENDYQLLHISRYIHLNPLTAFIINTEDDLNKYRWSSFIDHISDKPRPFINVKLVQSFFKDKNGLIKFIFNQLDYQRNLERIKHLTLEY